MDVEERVTKEGQLLKKGHLVRSWKSRWHVLQERSLEYFETQAKSVKKGSIAINHNTLVKPLPEGEFCFSILSDEKSLEIAASNEEERNAWIAAIQGVVCRNQLRILYRDCLTVNLYTVVSDALSLILPNDYVSYGSEIRSNVGFTNQIQQYWKTIPDLKWEVQEMIVEGNKVVVRSIASGSPRGDFLGLVGLDGSKSFHITAIDLHTIEEGRIKSTHHLEDWATALRQLSTTGYTDFSEKQRNLWSRSEFPPSLRESILSSVSSLYSDCLTVNSHSNPSEVLDRLFREDFISFGAQNKSKPALIAQVQQYWKTIPDLKWEVQEMIVEGNKVVVRSIASGSPRGDFLGLVGLDGSKSFHITAIDLHTIEEGRIKSTHHLEDWRLAADQLRLYSSFRSSHSSSPWNPSRELVLSLYDKCFTVNSRSDPDQVADRLLHDDFIAFGPPNKSKPEFIAQLQQFWKLVPDLRCEVQEMIAEGNKVAVFTFASGSPRGDFLGLVGLDGSKSFHITAIDIHTIEEGRIKSTHHLGDWGLAAEQLNWEISFDPRESNNIFYRPTTGFTQDRAEIIDILSQFYSQALTTNIFANVQIVMDGIFDENFISFGAQNKSKPALIAQVQQYWKMIPDLKWEVQEMIVEGNKVVVRSIASGSPRGDFLGLVGLDGSKSFHITAIDLHTIEEGRIKSTHHLEDWATARKQLG